MFRPRYKAGYVFTYVRKYIAARPTIGYSRLTGIMRHKNFIFVKIYELWSQSSYMLHKIHSHSHLILDPESALYDNFEWGAAPSEVVVRCRSRIQDQVAVGVDCA